MKQPIPGRFFNLAFELFPNHIGTSCGELQRCIDVVD